MKLELKLTADQIGFIVTTFESIGKISMADVQGLVIQTGISKPTLSIIVDVYDKFADKFKSIGRKSGIFDQDKKYTISLKYHEAYAINAYLTATSFAHNPHQQSMSEMVKDKIQRKLV
ncbi:MAG: hypothetical protein JST78_09675 [Bacteroidetes bacterium]|nr:hypothetical protein [Bacteroidota bacterium]